MDMRSNTFERRWFYIFMFMYVFIIIPFPFFFNTHYVGGWLGVPIFVYGWLIHGSVTLLLIVLFARQCLQRPEYKAFDAEQSQGANHE